MKNARDLFILTDIRRGFVGIWRVIGMTARSRDVLSLSPYVYLIFSTIII